MSRREQINEAIVNQKQNPFRGNTENTYLNDSIFKEFVKHRDLKRVYVTKLGLKYRWSDEEIQLIIDVILLGLQEADADLLIQRLGIIEGEGKKKKKKG